MSVDKNEHDEDKFNRIEEKDVISEVEYEFVEKYMEDVQQEIKSKDFKCPNCHETLSIRVTSLDDGGHPDSMNTGIYVVRERTKHNPSILAVSWKGLIRSFKHPALGEFKVVREAEGTAPWGNQVKAELNESRGTRTILVSLPELDGRVIAAFNGSLWEIWVTPKGEVHVVIPDKRDKNGYPPDQYLWLSADKNDLSKKSI